MAINYRGKTFPGYNQPVKSTRKDKKKMVLAKKGNEVKLIHYGQTGYTHNKTKAQKEAYDKRSANIRDGSGTLTKNNKLSANYWSRKDLWKLK